MHPALSIIFFTVTSGAGYGLIAVTALASMGALGVALESGDILFAGVAGLVAVTAGLMASSLHLANPKNAWRAFSRVRTSWLSREAVLSVLSYPFILAWLAAVWAQASAGLVTLLALAAVAAALATVFSTAMIYACLRTIPQWHTRLTPVNYVLLSLMIGFLGLAAVTASAEGAPAAVVWAALISVAAAAAAKVVYFVSFRVPSGPGIADATGFPNATVRLLDVGHSAGTFLTREFGFKVSRRLLAGLRGVTLALSFAVPAAALWLGRGDPGAPVSTGLALAAAYAGLLVERWLFFAEARHVVNLYHGAQRV